MKLSACIVVYNGYDEALKAAQTVLHCTRRYPVTLYLVDNASPDGSGKKLEQAVADGLLAAGPGQHVVVHCRTENGGFGTGHNMILPELDSDFHFILNPDIQLTADTLSDLADWMAAHPDAVMARPSLVFPDGKPQQLPLRRCALRPMLYRQLPRLSFWKGQNDHYLMLDEDLTRPIDAQSECANGCEFARYWMHNGFINVDNQKMSKSLHNFFTVRDVANLYGYEPIRYFMLTAGYRMPLNYTVDLIESCKNSLERLYTCRENLDFALSKTEFGTDETLKEKAEEAKKKFCTAMDDDLNTPDALAAVFDLVKDINTLSAASSKAALEAGAAAFDEITGVLGLMYNRKKDEVPAEVTELVEKRAAAKKAKDWAAADAIRAQLTEMGWAVKDTAQGPQLSKL